MQLLLTERFRLAYTSLEAVDQDRVKKALRLLAKDLKYPSLRVKKIQGTKGIWEARASRSLRITFQIEEGSILLRTVGRHDEALRNP
jgi:mRNA-degrading endonuclease RelE of RelBE toxin-antitoxin system